MDAKKPQRAAMSDEKVERILRNLIGRIRDLEARVGNLEDELDSVRGRLSLVELDP